MLRAARGLSTLIIHTARSTFLQRVVTAEALRLDHLLDVLLRAGRISVRWSRHFLDRGSLLRGIASGASTTCTFVGENTARTWLILARRLLDDGDGRVEVDAGAFSLALLEIVDIDVVDRVHLVLHIVHIVLLVVESVVHGAQAVVAHVQCHVALLRHLLRTAVGAQSNSLVLLADGLLHYVVYLGAAWWTFHVRVGATLTLHGCPWSEATR